MGVNTPSGAWAIHVPFMSRNTGLAWSGRHAAQLFRGRIFDVVLAAGRNGAGSKRAHVVEHPRRTDPGRSE